MEDDIKEAENEMDALIKNQSKDHMMFNRLEKKIRTLLKQKVSVSKIMQILKKSGFKGGREKLTNWLEIKGIRMIKHRCKKQTVEN